MSVTIEELIEENLRWEPVEEWGKEIKYWKKTGQIKDAKYI